jgi:hypothetical protein
VSVGEGARAASTAGVAGQGGVGWGHGQARGGNHDVVPLSRRGQGGSGGRGLETRGWRRRGLLLLLGGDGACA